MSKKSQLVESLKSKTVSELETELLEVRKKQFNLRMKAANGSLEKPHLITEARKTIARIKTIIAEKVKETVGETHAD
jgi:large subunit ribosomal protein L29